MNKFTKTLGGAVVALTLGFGGLALAAPAIADETTPVQTTQEVSPSPSPSTTPPTAEADTTPAPADTTEAPLTKSDKVVNTGETKTLSWLVPNGVNPNESTAIWPQTPYTTESCGVNWVQTDTYRYGTPEQKAVVDAFTADGLLTQGEDYPYYLSHVYTQQTACVEEPPATPVVGVCNAFEPTTYIAVDEQGTLPSTIVTSETRAKGYNQIDGNNLHVWTTEATSLGKAAGYFATPGLTLGHIGTPVINYAETSGVKPGFQIVLSTGRILVGEPSYYGDRFWSKKAQAGVPENDGYNASADLNTWFAAMGDVSVAYIGYSVGSGVVGDSLISSLSLGNGCDITFAPYIRPAAPEPTTRQTVVSDETVCFVNDDKTFPGGGSYNTVTTNYSTPFVWDAETETYVAGEEVVTSENTVTTKVDAEVCPATVIPPVVVEPPTTVTPPVADVVVQHAIAPVANILAFTGFNPAMLILVGFVVLVSGVIIVWASRKRIKNDETQL